jgi:3'-phosphoadenosine 5'-phosphosulfate sulfotransferase (PAPS reductase)/FAD synthetase
MPSEARMNSFIELKQPVKPESEVSSEKLIMAMAGISEKIDNFKKSIVSLLDANDSLVLTFSGGKDSSILALIALHTIVDYKNRGGIVPNFAIIHGNTLVENPEVSKLALAELDKMQAFLDVNGLNRTGSIHIAEPSITSDYIVSLIGGRTIGIMPDNSFAKCSVDLKIKPMTALKNKIFKELKSENGRVITLLGTRFDESVIRSKNMQKRRENSLDPVQGTNGEWILSPIADFTIEDVFLIFDYAKRGNFHAYSDLQSVLELYGAAAEPGACSLAAFRDSGGKDESCGGGIQTARFGCFMCLRIKKDSSLVNLSENDSKYSYLSNLNLFRNFIQNTHYDPSKRNWISRTIDANGQVTLSPNAYSASHCNDMLRIAISIDVREEREAAVLGIEPRFTLITRKRLVTIDLYWMRYGYQTRFEAMRIWNDVRKNGNEVGVPVIENPYTKLPKVKPVKLAFKDADFDNIFNGFRDVMTATADIETTESKGKKLDSIVQRKYGATSDYLEYLSKRVFAGGDTYANYLRRANNLKERDQNEREDAIYEATETADRLSFDEEGLNSFFNFPELGIDYYVDKFSSEAEQVAPTSGIYELLRLGFVSIKAGTAREMDRMIRMANQIDRLGIRGILSDPDALVETLGINIDINDSVSVEVNLRPVLPALNIHSMDLVSTSPNSHQQFSLF